MRNKTTKQVTVESQVVKAEIEALAARQMVLQGREMSLNLLRQMQNQGVTRPEFAWFVPARVN